MHLKTLFFAFLIAPFTILAQGYQHPVAVVQYSGGGDWYANPTSVPNLVTYANSKLPVQLNPVVDFVQLGTPDLFDYAMVHLTGHGNVVLSSRELENLRAYLLSGGFLHVDDNYGMDPYIRPILKNLLPEFKLVALGPSHPIFTCFYELKDGLPKVHAHDEKAPEAHAIFDSSGRMMVLYTYESDLGDGWESPDVHNDDPAVREKALQMGVNMLYYIFVQGGYPTTLSR